jgi:hypothetical protein
MGAAVEISTASEYCGGSTRFAMNHKARALIAIAALILGARPVNAQHVSVGHMSGGFSGHSIGHSTGYALGHMFGHRSGFHPNGKGVRTARGKGNNQEPPLAGAVMEHGRVVQMPGPIGSLEPPGQRFHRAPIVEFGAPRRNAAFPRKNNFGFGFCGSFGGFPEQRFFLRRDFDCFADGFFFDRFFVNGFLTGAFAAGEFSGVIGAFDTVDAAPESQIANSVDGEQPLDGGHDSTDERKPKSEQPLTLLQLTDGSMYGLTEYWLESGRIHYITNYGGENSLPLERIDMEKTIELNASQGKEFILRPRLPANQR